jgi:hypothetical protein
MGNVPIVHGYDYNQGVGWFIDDANLRHHMEKGMRFELVPTLRLNDDGSRTLVSVSLLPVDREPAVESPVVIRPRLKACVEKWPECEEGQYNPACCRFPKSCSCTVYSDEHVTPNMLE